MASPARAFRCGATAPETASPPPTPRRIPVDRSGQRSAKIVLQPRLCTLRSYAEKTARRREEPRGGGETASFFEALSEYIESSKKSQDFETISGRLAMIVFAATVTRELATGNSVFGKMDLQGIEEAGGACLAAVALAALFAWFSSARTRVGNIFTVRCNSFIDALIDQIVDGLFYDNDDI